MICSKCGKELSDSSLFCTECGNKIEKTSSSPQTGSIFDDGSEKTVYLPEENNSPAEKNLGFFGSEKTVLLEEEPVQAEEPAEKNLGFFGSEKTVLLEEEPVQAEEPAEKNLGFFGSEKTVLLDEEPIPAVVPEEKPLIFNDNNTTIKETPAQNFVPEQPAPVYPQPSPVQQPVMQNNYPQQPQQPMYGNPDMGMVPPMAGMMAPPMAAPQQEAAPVKVGKGRIFGASIVAFFAMIFLLGLSLVVCVKFGLSGGILKDRVEKLNLNTVFNAELDGKDVSENIYDSLRFGKVTAGNADISDLKDYIKESNFLEYAGENVEKYADYIINGEGKDPSITAEDITYDFFAENNDVADDVFGYELGKSELKDIRSNLESEDVDEALSVKEWEKEIGIDPKNMSYVVSYVAIGILAALVLILFIWIVIIVDKKGRHVTGFLGNILFYPGLIVFIAGAGVTAGSMIAFSITSNVVFYLASNILLPFGILALIVGFSELVLGFIFKKIGKGIKNRKKLADARQPVNQNPVQVPIYN